MVERRTGANIGPRTIPGQGCIWGGKVLATVHERLVLKCPPLLRCHHRIWQECVNAADHAQAAGESHSSLS